MWTPWELQRSGHSPSPAGTLSECCSCGASRSHGPCCLWKCCRDCLYDNFDGPSSSVVKFRNKQPWRFGSCSSVVRSFLVSGYPCLSITQSTRVACPMTSRTGQPTSWSEARSGQPTSWSEAQSTKWFRVSSFCHRPASLPQSQVQFWTPEQASKPAVCDRRGYLEAPALVFAGGVPAKAQPVRWPTGFTGGLMILWDTSQKATAGNSTFLQEEIFKYVLCRLCNL